MPIKLSLKLGIVFVGVFLLLASSIAYAGFGGGFRSDAGPVTPPPDMVSWWPGDGNTDDIIDGNDGTLEGDATYTTGIVGPGFRLDGTGGYVLVPDSHNLTITGDITIDAWMIRRRVGPETPSIVIKYESDVAGGGVAYALLLLSGDTSSAHVRFAVYETKDGSVSRVLDTDAGVVPALRVTHIAGTFDLATQDLKIYVNGSEVAATLVTSDVITSIYPSTSPVRIGAIQASSGEVTDFFEGVIDEVEIFNRALTRYEVRSIFSARRAGKIKPTPTPTPFPLPTPLPTPTPSPV